MRKNTKTFLIIIVLPFFIIIGLCPTSAFAWGDNEGGRPSYSLQQINEGKLGDKITFNSIDVAETDAAWYKDHFNEDYPDDILTHEKNFVSVCEITNADTNRNWNYDDITVEDGKEYLIRLYLSNNNPNGHNAVAENVKVAFSIPSFSSKQLQVNGFIESSNASPSEYWDDINFNSNTNNFHLEYIYGSAMSKTIGDEHESMALGDEIVTEATNGGVQIGYNALDGRIPGGLEYRCYVTVRVRAVFDENFLVEKKVRMNGTKEWSKTVEAKVGDKVDFQIQYKNTSDQRQADVIVKDTLPSNLRYVPGTIKIKNGSHPNGDTVDGDALVTGGLKVGSYGKNSNVYLMFTAEVVDDNLACGSNTLVNWAQAMVGDTVGQDYARVLIQNNAGFYLIVAGYGIAITICFIVIVILIRRIIKNNKTKKYF